MFRLLGLLLLWPAPPPIAQHVVIIGCDGMSPDGVRKAKVPNLKQLMKTGAYTLHARGVMPTSSSPNWASMIMGAGPEQHGVTSNDWQPNKSTPSTPPPRWPTSSASCRRLRGLPGRYWKLSAGRADLRFGLV